MSTKVSLQAIEIATGSYIQNKILPLYTDNPVLHGIVRGFLQFGLKGRLIAWVKQRYPILDFVLMADVNGIVELEPLEKMAYTIFEQTPSIPIPTLRLYIERADVQDFFAIVRSISAQQTPTGSATAVNEPSAV